LYVDRPATYWFIAAPVAGAVSVSDGGLNRPTVPRPFRVGFILSCSPSSSEFLRPPSRPRLATRPLLPGFRPSSRRHRRHPHPLPGPVSEYVGFPGPTVFRPQAFSTSRRFALPPASRACFIPQPRPGFSRSGGSLDPQRVRLVAAPCLRVVSDARAHRQAGCHPHDARLRGVAPRTDAFRAKGG